MGRSSRVRGNPRGTHRWRVQSSYSNFRTGLPGVKDNSRADAIGRVMSWFTPKAEPKSITIVELEKLTPIEETPDSVAAVASLRSHHGFQWLVKKLKLQAARLKAELENTKQT